MKKISGSLIFSVGFYFSSFANALESIDAGGVTITPTLTMSAGYLYNQNQAFGGRTSSLGLPVDKSSSRLEAYAKPGLTMTGPQSEFGSVYGGVSSVAAISLGDTDGAGLTRDDPSSVSLEAAYVGWKSGDLLSSLGKDALKVSVGRQNFILGDGFMIGDGRLEQAKDAAFWMGARTAFDNTLLVQLDYSDYHFDLFDVTSNNDIDYLDYRDRLRMRGLNFEWRGKADNIGISILRTKDADNEFRDNIDVYNIRFKASPILSIPELNFAGGYVLQKKDSENNNAWYMQTSYSFVDVAWQPRLTYRRSEFSEGYDALNYSYMGEWGTWFQGEIVGEYMLFLQNTTVDMLKLSAQPTERLAVGIIGYRHHLYDGDIRGGGHRDFADELNVYADFALTQNLYLQMLYGVAFPGEAARSIYGADKTSQIFEAGITWQF